MPATTPAPFDFAAAAADPVYRAEYAQWLSDNAADADGETCDFADWLSAEAWLTTGN